MTSRLLNEELIAEAIVQFERDPVLLPGQQAGIDCAWCGNATGADGYDLGLTRTGDLRGCAPCYANRRAWVESYYAWFGHTQSCDVCRRRDVCPVAYGYRVLHEKAVTDLGQLLTCGECKGPVLRSQPSEPMIAPGYSGTLLLVTHLGPCPRGSDR